MIVEDGARIPRNNSYPLSLKSRPWVAVSSRSGRALAAGFGSPGSHDRFTETSTMLSTLTHPPPCWGSCPKYGPQLSWNVWEPPLLILILAPLSVATSASTKPWRMCYLNREGSLLLIRVRTV